MNRKVSTYRITYQNGALIGTLLIDALSMASAKAIFFRRYDDADIRVLETREVFKTEIEAAEFLFDQGYDLPANNTAYWVDKTSLIKADIRYNDEGYFITYQA